VVAEAPDRGKGLKARALVGCGMVLDGEGHLLTTSSVVRNATVVTVIPPSGDALRATVIGTDPLWDLAVVRLPAGRLPGVLVGDSDSLRTGAWVTLLGSGFGSGPVASLGVVTGRALPALEPGADVLRVYAPIRPGDSGAMLLNGNGEVVGIVSATLETSPGELDSSLPQRTRALRDYVEGIAVPMNQALAAAWDLIERGPVRRGFLGVRIRAVAPPLAERMGLEPGLGAFVVGVVEGSPASETGIWPGDIILKVDGTPVRDLMQLHRWVLESPPGTERQLTLLHAGRPRVVSVRTADCSPFQDQIAPRYALEPGSPGPTSDEVRRKTLAAEVAILKARLADLERQVEHLDR